MHKRGRRVSQLSAEKMLSHNTERFRRGTLLSFKKFLVSKNFMDKRYHDYVRNFLSQSAKKINKGTLQCSRKFRVSKNFMDKKGGGSITISSKMFCLTVPKNFVGEPSSVSEKVWYRKILWIKGNGGYHDFPSS